MIIEQAFSTVIENEYCVNHIFQNFKSQSIQKILASFEQRKNEKQFRDPFYYYLWLFREDSDCLRIINHKDFASDQTLDFIYHSFGFWISTGKDPDLFFAEIARFISKEKSIQLLTETDLLNIDLNLSLHFISSLSIKEVEFIFKNTTESIDIASFINEIFIDVEIDSIKKIFVNNFELYSFLLEYLPSTYAQKYKEKYSEIVDDFSRISIARQITDLVREKFSAINNEIFQKKINAMNSEKVEYLVYNLSDFKNSADILDILKTRMKVINDNELQVINFVLSDPEFKNKIISKIKSSRTQISNKKESKYIKIEYK